MRKRKITPKQEAFCQAVAAGNTLSGAYRLAYSADNMSDGSVHREASVLGANPMVSQRILTIQGEIAAASRVSEVSDRERVLEKLRVMMDGAKAETVQLNAAIALGKTQAMFTDVSQTRDDSRTAADLQKELDDLLAEVEQAGDKVIPFKKQSSA